jgi:hypothetical protein
VSPRAPQGTVLVVVLILLGALSLMSLGGLRSATVELAMARNAYYARAAFDAAETGVELMLVDAHFSVHTPTVLMRTGLGRADASVTAVATFQGKTSMSLPGFSLGADIDALAAYHFEIVSTGTAPRNATAVHRAGFIIIGP